MIKKIGIFCFSVLLLIGCTKSGRTVEYELEDGNLRLTFTRDYIIIDSLHGFNNFGNPEWECNKTVSRSDSVACHELLEGLLKK